MLLMMCWKIGIETVGLPWTLAEHKQYLANALPASNIIMVDAHVARPYFLSNQHHTETVFLAAPSWVMQSHCAFLLVFPKLALALLRQYFHKWIIRLN